MAKTMTKTQMTSSFKDLAEANKAHLEWRYEWLYT